MTDYWKAVARACALAKAGRQAAYVVGVPGLFVVLAEAEVTVEVQPYVLVRVGS